MMNQDLKLKNVIATRQRRLLTRMLMYLRNPDATLAEKGIEVYRNMLNDAHVYSCVQSRTSGVLKLKWNLNIDEAYKMQADFVQTILKSLDFRRIIREMLEAVLYGFKPMEILWQYINGYIIPVDIVGKPSEWFIFNDLNQCLFKSARDIRGEILPAKKFLIVQNNPDYNNPYGESVLTKCYYPVMFKKGIMEFWLRFAEKYGMPFMVAILGEDASPELIDNTLDAMDDAAQDGALALAVNKDQSSVSLMEASKTSSADVYERFVHFCNAEVSKAILSQTLTTEQGPTGSYAMSQTHLQVRDDVIEADKNLVELYINKLIRWICEINFGVNVKPPVFEMYSEKDVDKTLAERDSMLANTGLIRFTKLYFSRAYGFKDDEIEIVEQSTGPNTFSEDDDVAEEQQNAIDKTTALSLDDLDEASRMMVEPLLKVIETGADYKVILDSLIETYTDMDTSKIEDNLNKAILIANGVGQLAAVRNN